MDDYVSVYTANGQWDAQMIKIFLESAGIQVILAGESVGTVYGLNVGPVAEVQIFVNKEQAEDAIGLLDRMEKGELENPDLPKES